MGYEQCEKCGKKQKYYREAFGSYECYACGNEIHIDTPSFDARVYIANSWWASLTNDKKIEVMNNAKTTGNKG